MRAFLCRQLADRSRQQGLGFAAPLRHEAVERLHGVALIAVPETVAIAQRCPHAWMPNISHTQHLDT